MANTALKPAPSGEMIHLLEATEALPDIRGVVFPHILCRLSVLPVERLGACGDGAVTACVDGILDAERGHAALRESASQALFDLIGRTSDDDTRKDLIGLRRDLFNMRDRAPADVALLPQDSPGAPWESVERCNQLAGIRRDAMEELVGAYDAALAVGRARLGEEIADPEFQRGLLLSSPVLFDQVRRYLGRRGLKPGRRERVERGVLRYFARAAVKATPFGRFCTLVPGRLTNVQGRTGPLFRMSGDLAKKKSQVRLNKRLFDSLWNHLARRPAIREGLTIEVNPTVEEDGSELAFIQRSEARHTRFEDREVFQRLSYNPAIGLVVDVLRGPEVVCYKGLVGQLLECDELAADEGEIRAYLDRLLDIGFLRLTAGIGPQEVDWDLPFTEALRGVDDEHAGLTVALLDVLRSAVDAYGDAGLTERRALEDKATTAFRRASTDLGLTGEVLHEPLWYEDTRAQGTAEVLLFDDVSETLAVFAEYAGEVLHLAWPRTMQATVRAVFERLYGPERGPVPLLRFFQDYYREYFQDYLEKKARLQAGDRTSEDLKGYDLANPLNLDFVGSVLAAHRRFTAVIADRWGEAPDAEELTLSAEDLRDVLGDVPRAPLEGASGAVFTRFARHPETGVPRLVLKGAGVERGYGKYLSRFLSLLPELGDHVRDRNGRLSGDLLTEICADANFNANLHPPLLPYEMAYPTGERGFQRGITMECSDIDVVPAPDDPHALHLRHRPSGVRVVPADLGFLNPYLRPPLYQLLTHFQGPGTHRVTLPDLPSPSAPRDADPDTPRVLRRPRVTYRDRIVLAPMQWLVPGSTCPVPTAEEKDWEYFLRLNRWRAEAGLPAEVFVRFTQAKAPQIRRAADPPTDADDPGTADEGAEPAEGGDGQTDEPDLAESGLQAAEAAPGGIPASEGRPQRGPERASATRSSRDIHKPQYIDFTNPLFVRLFGHTASTLNLDHLRLILEERLPSARDLPSVGGEHHAVELILECDFPDRAFGEEGP